MVMMFAERVWLMWSIIAARVVVLPDPVGPVTRIIPRCSSARRVTIGGRPRSSTDSAAGSTRRRTIAALPRWRKALPRKRPSPSIDKEKSASPVRWNSSIRSTGMITRRHSSTSCRSTGGNGVGRRSPLTRTRGAALLFRCRSEPPTSVTWARMACKSSTVGLSGWPPRRLSRSRTASVVAPLWGDSHKRRAARRRQVETLAGGGRRGRRRRGARRRGPSGGGGGATGEAGGCLALPDPLRGGQGRLPAQAVGHLRRPLHRPGRGAAVQPGDRPHRLRLGGLGPGAGLLLLPSDRSPPSPARRPGGGGGRGDPDRPAGPARVAVPGGTDWRQRRLSAAGQAPLAERRRGGAAAHHLRHLRLRRRLVRPVVGRRGGPVLHPDGRRARRAPVRSRPHRGGQAQQAGRGSGSRLVGARQHPRRSVDARRAVPGGFELGARPPDPRRSGGWPPGGDGRGAPLHLQPGFARPAGRGGPGR